MARSTTEAEIISMATGMFSEVCSLQSFIEYLVQQTVHVIFEDAVLKILGTGYSAKLCHCGRVHRVNVALDQECFSAEYCPSSEQREGKRK